MNAANFNPTLWTRQRPAWLALIETLENGKWREREYVIDEMLGASTIGRKTCSNLIANGRKAGDLELGTHNGSPAVRLTPNGQARWIQSTQYEMSGEPVISDDGGAQWAISNGQRVKYEVTAHLGIVVIQSGGSVIDVDPDAIGVLIAALSLAAARA